ncbi:MAG TPA: hypothetical protein VEK34_16745 [Methylocella sp.]|nr:hypothetical protein [Methylocella sp.]
MDNSVGKQTQLSDPSVVSTTKSDGSDKSKFFEERFEQDRRILSKLISESVVGSNDWYGRKIVRMFSKYPRFVLYHGEGDREDDPLRLLFVGEDDAREKLMTNNYNEILIDLSKVYSVLHKARNPTRILRMLAAPIAFVLDAEESNKEVISNFAKHVLETILREINEEYSRLITGKFSYIIGCLIVVIVSSIISAVCFIFRELSIINNNILLIQMLYGATFASYGGFTSVSISLNQQDFETGLRNIQFLLY